MTMTNNIWFTSDWHLGHARIAEFEPARSVLGGTVEERDANLIERFNEVVRPGDSLYNLGDVSMGPIDYSLPLVGQINGRKRLVPGNHDRCWIGDKRHAKWTQRYLDAGFADILPEQTSMTIGGRRVNLCHFPYDGDSHGTGNDRHKEYRMSDRSVPIVHGHVHSEFAERGNQFNVGVDVRDYRPVHYDEIVAWLDRL
jgi:calcineurin-like phosphoesterase family protein